MKKQYFEKTLKRLHFLRMINRIQRITVVVGRISTALSFLFLAINLIGVIKLIPER